MQYRDSIASVGFSLLLVVVVSCAKQEIPFQSNAWKTDRDQRPQMVRSLLANHKIVGMARTEVHDLLGEPTAHGDSVIDDRYVYWAGTDGVIDDLWLEIEFSGDTVSDVRHAPD